jgi:guanylate kinase
MGRNQFPCENRKRQTHRVNMSDRTLITVTGPTCSGKTTLQKYMMTRGLKGLVSFTTRPPREGEVDGKDYWFIANQEYLRFLHQKEIVETIQLGQYHYGMLAREIDEKLKMGTAVVVVEPNGANQLHAYCVEHGVKHKAIYITNPTAVLVARFLDRFKTDNKATSSNYATRLIQMVESEQNWIFQYKYDMIFNSFTPQNENTVIEEILMSVFR